MTDERSEFAEFYRQAKDECLTAVLVSVGDRGTAHEVMAEAFSRAWASWRAVGRHPPPKAWVIRTALNANVSRWRRRRREVPLSEVASVTELALVDEATCPEDQGRSTRPRPGGGSLGS